MNLKLRSLTSAEAAAIESLVTRALEESAATYLADADEDLSPGTAARLLGELEDWPESMLVVAEAPDEEQPMGVCLAVPFDDPLLAVRTACIVGLWVDPKLRHRGVARALVQEITRLLAQRGVTRVAARTGHNDDALISMGERWGFVRSWDFLLHE